MTTCHVCAERWGLSLINLYLYGKGLCKDPNGELSVNVDLEESQVVCSIWVNESGQGKCNVKGGLQKEEASCVGTG